MQIEDNPPDIQDAINLIIDYVKINKTLVINMFFFDFFWSLTVDNLDKKKRFRLRAIIQRHAKRKRTL